jgi:hypothetical protein
VKDEPVSHVPDLSALTSDERVTLRQLGAQLLDAIQSTAELHDGYAFELVPGGMSLEELGRLIQLERRCCPFLGYDVELNSDRGVTLLITGGADETVKLFIQHEYPRRFR